MDLLDSLIFHLSTEERKEFNVFLRKISSSRLEPRLFRLLISDKVLTPHKMAGKLYQPINMNAYHSLRKRLIHHIGEFIVLKRVQFEVDASGGVTAMGTIGRLMLDRNANDLAGYFLKKAEKIAKRNHQYEELESIYKLLVTHANQLQLDLNEVVKDWQKNGENYSSFRKLTIASATIKSQIEWARVNAERVDPEQLIEQVMQEIELTEVEANNPAFLHTLIDLARSAFANTKEYHKLEPYVIRIYKRLKKNEAFGPNDVQLEQSFLFIIAHTLYRNRKFETSIEWLTKLEEIMPAEIYKSTPLYAKYLSLKAATFCCTGKNEWAIALLEECIAEKNMLGDIKEKFNMRINLTVYYFNAGEYRKANKELIKLGHSDKFLEQKMGKEWRYKKNMIEIIVHFELGNYELARTLLKRARKQFATFITQPKYQSAAVFMKFIAVMLNTPELIKTDEFKETVRETNIGIIDMKHDIQAVSFYSWLRSKMMSRNYYEVLLERISA